MLIAVIGPPGAGKTAVLDLFMARLNEDDRFVRYDSKAIVDANKLLHSHQEDLDDASIVDNAWFKLTQKVAKTIHTKDILLETRGTDHRLQAIYDIVAHAQYPRSQVYIVKMMTDPISVSARRYGVIQLQKKFLDISDKNVNDEVRDYGFEFSSLNKNLEAMDAHFTVDTCEVGAWETARLLSNFVDKVDKHLISLVDRPS